MNTTTKTVFSLMTLIAVNSLACNQERRESRDILNHNDSRIHSVELSEQQNDSTDAKQLLSVGNFYNIVPPENLLPEDFDTNNYVISTFGSERIRGVAVVRDAPDGNALFALFNNVAVECGAIFDGWYEVAISLTIDNSEYENFILRPGRVIPSSGWVINQTALFSSTIYEGNFIGSISGYTHHSNIRPESIIEHELTRQLDSDNPDIGLAAFSDIIKRFMLRETYVLDGYVTFFNYETRLVDPSPSARLMLVFDNDNLVCVVHSRPFSLKNYVRHNLPRGYTCHIHSQVKTPEKLLIALNEYFSVID